MRIISGTHKGKKIQAPKNLPVRPTTDMAKESLFNILNNFYYLDDISALDLFSGTGNISFELASRGAKNITAIEQDKACIRFISTTAKNLGYEHLQVIKADVFKFTERPSSSYDIVFADPPYELEQEQYNTLIENLFANKYLTERGTLIVEHNRFIHFSEHPKLSETRSYGSVNFSFFEQSK